MRWLAILALAGCAGWSRKDTALESAFFLATTIDWGQTQDITAACDEVNPVMGSCGQRVPVGAYFPMLLLAHVAIAAALPPSWRSTFQGFTLGMELTTTYWNHREVMTH